MGSGLIQSYLWCLQVLELGAGCGLLGMLVARNLPLAGEVCLTEQAHGGALEHLQKNVEANKQLPNMSSVTTCSCDWTHFMDDKLVQQLRAGAQQSATAAAAGNTSQTAQQKVQRQQHTHQQPQADPESRDAAAADRAAASEVRPSAAVPSTSELADMQRLLSTPWDIIIGSDLIYNTAGVKGLPKVLAALMQHSVPASTHSSSCHSCSCTSSSTPGQAASSCCRDATTCSSDFSKAHQSRQKPVFYYAHTKHRFDAYDVDLFAELEGLGLSVEEVVEDGEQLPPPSPPPFSSLYPEMRCAVFRVSKSAG